jgi:hypothetical protein
LTTRAGRGTIPCNLDTGLREGSGRDGVEGPKRWTAVTLTPEERDALKQQVVACLRNEPEVRRIVLFGSFVGSPSPQDEEGGQYDER